jgi:hypothetical protein
MDENDERKIRAGETELGQLSIDRSWQDGRGLQISLDWTGLGSDCFPGPP